MFNQYRDKALSSLENNRSWDVPRDVLFARLDSFIERCEDMLEVT